MHTSGVRYRGPLFQPHPDLIQEDLQEERHHDGEDGAAGGDESVGEADVSL